MSMEVHQSITGSMHALVLVALVPFQRGTFSSTSAGRTERQGSYPPPSPPPPPGRVMVPPNPGGTVTK